MIAGSFNELSRQSQALVCLMLAALLTAAGWQTFVRPARIRLAADHSRLASLEGQAAKARAIAARLPATAREAAELESRLGDPEWHVGEPVSLATLHQIAGDAGLAITSFEPESPVRHADHTEQALVLGLAGSYHGLGAFFDRLASTDGLLVVTALDVRTGTALADSDTLEAKCRITSVLLDTYPRPGAAVATSTEHRVFMPTYDADLRRDPFLDRTRSVPPAGFEPTRRADGLAGLTAADVVLRGVARKGSDILAILEGPDGRSYVGRVGTRLHDAAVLHIAGDAVVLARDDQDGGRGEHVRKPLHAQVASR